MELILVVFHWFQFGPGSLYERSLLVNGVLQAFDNLSDLLGCHSSAAGSGVGWLRGGLKGLISPRQNPLTAQTTMSSFVFSKIPRPTNFGCKSTSDHRRGNDGSSSQWAFCLHEKYGHLIHLGLDKLSYSDSSSWKDIYASQPTQSASMPQDLTLYHVFEEKNLVYSQVKASNKGYSNIRRAYAFSK